MTDSAWSLLVSILLYLLIKRESARITKLERSVSQLQVSLLRLVGELRKGNTQP